MITLDLSILNQKGTPMFYSDITANRPTFGIVGRIFIATDSPYGIFRDTGSSWEQVAGSGGGGGNTIYTANDTLTSNRIVSSGGFTLTFAPQTTFLSSLTAATNASIYSALGQNTLSYAAGFSSSNLGLTYGAIGGINLQTFAGSATFAQSNLAAANISVNSIDFSSAGSTITMTQAAGLRVMAGHQSQFQYQGTNSGTITHAAISQNLGFYRPPSATGVLTITNAYGHLINDLNDYGSGFTFTNRWGIYQAGTNDKNYFAGNILSGSTSDTGQKLQITGSGALITGGTEINTNIETALILKGSATNKFIELRLQNINANGRIYGLRSDTDGKLSLLNYTSLSNLYQYDPTNTQHTFNGSQVNLIGSSITNVGLWLNTTSGTLSNYTLYSVSGITLINSIADIRFSLSNVEKYRLSSAGNFLIASTTDTGEKLQLNGSLRINGQRSATAGGSSGQHLIINCDGVSYKIVLLNP